VRKTSQEWFSYLILLVVEERLIMLSFSVVLLSKPSNKLLSLGGTLEMFAPFAKSSF